MSLNVLSESNPRHQGPPIYGRRSETNPRSRCGQSNPHVVLGQRACCPTATSLAHEYGWRSPHGVAHCLWWCIARRVMRNRLTSLAVLSVSTFVAVGCQSVSPVRGSQSSRGVGSQVSRPVGSVAFAAPCRDGPKRRRNGQYRSRLRARVWRGAPEDQ